MSTRFAPVSANLHTKNRPNVWRYIANCNLDISQNVNPNGTSNFNLLKAKQWPTFCVILKLMDNIVWKFICSIKLQHALQWIFSSIWFICEPKFYSIFFVHSPCCPFAMNMNLACLWFCMWAAHPRLDSLLYILVARQNVAAHTILLKIKRFNYKISSIV